MARLDAKRRSLLKSLSTDTSQIAIVRGVEGRLQRVLGANVRSIRKDLGVSQEQMAERLSWHRTYLGGVERGERNLTLRSVERLADQLGMDPVDLLREDGPG